MTSGVQTRLGHRARLLGTTRGSRARSRREECPNKGMPHGSLQSIRRLGARAACGASQLRGWKETGLGRLTSGRELRHSVSQREAQVSDSRVAENAEERGRTRVAGENSNRVHSPVHGHVLAGDPRCRPCAATHRADDREHEREAAPPWEAGSTGRARLSALHSSTTLEREKAPLESEGRRDHRGRDRATRRQPQKAGTHLRTGRGTHWASGSLVAGRARAARIYRAGSSARAHGRTRHAPSEGPRKPAGGSEARGRAGPGFTEPTPPQERS